MMAALALRRLLRAMVAGNPAARARMVEVMERRYEDARGRRDATRWSIASSHARPPPSVTRSLAFRVRVFQIAR